MEGQIIEPGAVQQERVVQELLTVLAHDQGCPRGGVHHDGQWDLVCR